MWDDQVTALADRYRVIRYDQRGFVRVADLLAGEIPGARRVVLPGFDHNVPVRAARKVTALLADFLDEVHPQP